MIQGFVLHEGAQLLCAHGGQVDFETSDTHVKVDGHAVLTMNDADTFEVSDCPFHMLYLLVLRAQPCVTVRWVPSMRVRASGYPVIMQSSIGICQSEEQISQGAPIVVMSQIRVKGI